MIALAAAATAFAQFPSGLSVGAGYVDSKQVWKTDDDTHKEGFGGFYVGADYNIAIADFGLGVAPGIYVDFLTNKDYPVDGAKWKEVNLGIPVMFNYAIPVADILKITPFAGPTLQLGLSSKMKDDDNTHNVYSDDDADYGRLQLFVGGGVAFDIADIVRFSIGYDLGLLNRNTGDQKDDLKVKNNGLHFGIAYLF